VFLTGKGTNTTLY